jgi:hypothetical protein
MHDSFGFDRRDFGYRVVNTLIIPFEGKLDSKKRRFLSMIKSNLTKTSELRVIKGQLEFEYENENDIIRMSIGLRYFISVFEKELASSLCLVGALS